MTRTQSVYGEAPIGIHIDHPNSPSVLYRVGSFFGDPFSLCSEGVVCRARLVALACQDHRTHDDDFSLPVGAK